MKHALLALAFLPLFACSTQDGDDPPADATPFRVTGEVVPIVPGRPLLAAAQYELTVRRVWQEGERPFPDDAMVIGEVEVAEDLQFSSELMPMLPVAGLYLDDAPGSLDLTVRTVMDRRVSNREVVEQDALAFDRALLDAWIASDPRLGGRDLEAEGMLLLRYVSTGGASLEGVEPIAASSDAVPYFISADHQSIDTAATRTTASGLVLYVGEEGALYGGTHETIELEALGAAVAPGGCFTETIGPAPAT